jgi:hypothetical protein
MSSSPCPHDDDDRTNNTTRLLDRKRQAWEQCHVNIDTLDTLLDMPVRAHDSPESAAFSARVWLDRISPILTGTAHALSRSYVDVSDFYQEYNTAQSPQSHSAAIAGATAATANASSHPSLMRGDQNINVQENMQQLLNDLIPVTTRQHRNKRSKTSLSLSGRSRRQSSATTTPITTNQQHQPQQQQQQQQLSREETITKVQELLHQQKESIQERHQLLLLPHRGCW